MRFSPLLTSLLLLANLSAVQADDEKPHDFPVVEVDGQAFEDVKPDKAVISFGIVLEAKTAAEAAAEMAKRAQTLAAEIRAAGVDARDIKTASLRIDPVYVEERDPNTHRMVERKLTGFRGSNHLAITTRDVDGVGGLVTRLLANQANTLQGVQFSVEDGDDRRTKLLGKAVADAKRKAQLIAEGASMKLGPVVEIDFADREDGAADLPSYKSAPGPVSLVIPVEPGVERLSANISAKWRLLEK